MRPPRPTTPARTAGLILAIAVVDALVARSALAIADVEGVVPVWPSAGVALAVLIWGGRRLWPAVLAGSLAGNLLAGAPLAGAPEAVNAATVLAAWAPMRGARASATPSRCWAPRPRARSSARRWARTP